MKIPQYNSNRTRERGSILLAALIFGVLAGGTLAWYLMFVDEEHREVVRSQNWNNALAYTEAAVDEALAQMCASPGDFSANGWNGSPSPGTTGTYTAAQRNLSGGYYTVSIKGGVSPTIYATGFVYVADSGDTVKRAVAVQTTPKEVSPFQVGLGAVGSINMNGNGAASDSWNSQTNTQSTGGQFDSNKTSTNGSVASVDGIVNIGNHTIDGNLYLGPTATYQSGVGQVLGTIYYDYNIQFPDVTLPTVDANGNSVSWVNGTETTVGSGKTAVTSYHFTSANNNGYYIVNNSDGIIVDPGVTVTLQVTVQSYAPTGLAIGGGTTNAGTVIMYHNPTVNGNQTGSINLAGNSIGGAVDNRPVNFQYYGMPTVTSITLGGTSTFIGAIYAPEASLTLNGGGNSNNLEGAAIVNNVTLNGHYDFHYDVSLANYVTGPSRGYIPFSWQEL